MTDLASLERYRPLVDDWAGFCAALARPLPTCAWVNTLRARPGEVLDRLAADGVEVSPLPWLPGAFRLPAGISAGNRFEHLAGLYRVQEEVSMLPVVLLDPRPGERVLDLCAAPGGKTAQIAAAMAGRGTVVANDRDRGRLSILRSNLERLGIANVVLTHHDGSNYPAAEACGVFDRVLADVPCSCEGTSRKSPEVLDRAGLESARRLAGIQKALLRKAIQLARPGGRIVYSTCTYAPEENEAVVDAVLGELPAGAVRLLPAAIEGFAGEPGLTAWNGERFAPELREALRVWPHHNDSGGFFVAVLEKRAGESPLSAPAELPFEEVDPAPWRALLEERFGLPPAALSGYLLLRAGRRHLGIVPRDLAPPGRPPALAAGLRLLHLETTPPKLTTAAAMAFGGRAERNVIELTREQADAYLARQGFEVAGAQASRVTGAGHVLVRLDGFCLGVGHFRPAAEGGWVDSLFPKARALAPGRSAFQATEVREAPA